MELLGGHYGQPNWHLVSHMAEMYGKGPWPPVISDSGLIFGKVWYYRISAPGIGGFHTNVSRNFNDMQMIFNALSGSSGQVPVTPVGGNKLYCALQE